MILFDHKQTELELNQNYFECWKIELELNWNKKAEWK